MINHQNKIFIGGVQGVGKSTTIGHLLETHPSIYKAFSFGENIKNLAINNFPHYTGIHNLNNQERNIIIRRLYKNLENILQDNPEKTFLFDNHFIIHRENAFQNTFIDEKICFYNKLILLIADPKIISNRIQCHTNKERVPLSSMIDFIEQHQELEQSRASYLSKKYSLPLLEIINANISETSNLIHSFIYE